jgi:acetyl-CoA carboxylase biotin carboxyl carrier protein
VDLTRVEELIELMRQSGVTQLSLELPDFRVSITRGPEGTWIDSPPQLQSVGEQPSPEAPGQPEQPEAVAAASALPVVAPVVGVFHNGGMLDPREPIREGDRVREGQLLAAIEAMKVPNELRSPANGVISRLLVENGATVEYGQTLLLIEPDTADEASDDDSSIGVA